MSNLSATKIGQLLDPPLKGHEVNKLLAQRGYLEYDKATNLWHLTSLGEKYGVTTSGRLGIIVFKKSLVKVLQAVEAG